MLARREHVRLWQGERRVLDDRSLHGDRRRRRMEALQARGLPAPHTQEGRRQRAHSPGAMESPNQTPKGSGRRGQAEAVAPGACAAARSPRLQACHNLPATTCLPAVCERTLVASSAHAPLPLAEDDHHASSCTLSHAGQQRSCPPASTTPIRPSRRGAPAPQEPATRPRGQGDRPPLRVSHQPTGQVCALFSVFSAVC